MAKATFHIDAGGRPLCGNDSFTAMLNCAECGHCQKKMDALLTLLLDLTGGRPGAAENLKRFAVKLGLCRVSHPAEDPPRASVRG